MVGIPAVGRNQGGFGFSRDVMVEVVFGKAQRDNRICVEDLSHVSLRER